MAFDESISGLPDFRTDESSKSEVANDLDLIIDLPLEEPTEKQTSGIDDIFIMKNKKNIIDKKNPIELKVNPREEKEPEGISLEISKTNIELPKERKKEKYENIGKRGRDKKPRKKRILSEAAKEKLALARKKSLEVRRENARVKYAAKKNKQQKETIKEIVPDATILNQTNNFNQFCEFMDRYEARKIKKVSNSHDPHPNKIIPTNQKPRPPIIHKAAPPKYYNITSNTILKKPEAITPKPVQQPQYQNLRKTPQVQPHIPPPTSMMDKFNAIRSNNRSGYGNIW